MKNDIDAIDNEVIDRLTPGYLLKLDKQNYKYSKRRIIGKARKRIAKRMHEEDYSK